MAAASAAAVTEISFIYLPTGGEINNDQPVAGSVHLAVEICFVAYCNDRHVFLGIANTVEKRHSRATNRYL